MNIFLYTLCALLFSGTLFFLHSQRKRTFEQNKIRQLREKVQDALEDNPTAADSEPFEQSLARASITTNLQKTRLQLQSGTKGAPPEKYTFFSNLLAKGMKAEEIAEILQISKAEASQLVQLSMLSGCQQ